MMPFGFVSPSGVFVPMGVSPIVVVRRSQPVSVPRVMPGYAVVTPFGIVNTNYRTW
jgi:hypothetical protein